MKLTITSDAFPSLEKMIRASWAPIILDPTSEGYERLVVGFTAVSQNDFLVKKIDSLYKLRCLYGDESKSIFNIVDLFVDSLKEDISRRKIDALREPRSIASNIFLGDLRDGAGRNLEEIYKNWARMICSFYEDTEEPLISSTVETKKTKEKDRLAQLIVEYVTSKRNSLLPCFREEWRLAKKRSSSSSYGPAQIDFSGSNLVANLGTLRFASVPNSVRQIKFQMWDLLIDRDNNRDSLFHRDHEMLVLRPANDDPQMTEGQSERVNDALLELEYQADKEELRLRPFHSIAAMGDRLLEAEAA